MELPRLVQSKDIHRGKSFMLPYRIRREDRFGLLRRTANTRICIVLLSDQMDLRGF